MNKLLAVLCLVSLVALSTATETDLSNPDAAVQELVPNASADVKAKVKAVITKFQSGAFAEAKAAYDALDASEQSLFNGSH